MVQIVLSDQSLYISRRLLLKDLVIRWLEEFLSYLEASTPLGSHGLQIYGEVFRLGGGAWTWVGSFLHVEMPPWGDASVVRRREKTVPGW